MVVSNYYNNPNCESHDVEHGEKGGLWGQIISPSYNVNEINEVIFNGLWRKIGKGNSTLFWEHNWIGDRPLKELFAGLYNMSNQQRTLVADMGF